MTLEQALAAAERRVDEIIAESVERFEEVLIEHGATAEDLDRNAEFQRQNNAEWKRDYLEQLARFLAEWDAPSVRLQ